MAKVLRDGDVITLEDDNVYAVFKTVDIGAKTYALLKAMPVDDRQQMIKLVQGKKLGIPFNVVEEIVHDDNVTVVPVQDEALKDSIFKKCNL